LACMLMATMFLEMSLFFFLYESCSTCLLSIPFILTYWVCSSAINMVLGLSFIVLTGEMDHAKKRRVMAVCTLAFMILLAMIGCVIHMNFP
jgi:uncharacterized membrane protein